MPRATVEIAGDDIPADAPVGEMIERRETAGQLIRVLPARDLSGASEQAAWLQSRAGRQGRRDRTGRTVLEEGQEARRDQVRRQRCNPERAAERLPGPDPA